ncbi:MAG: transporter substrate-binding domain-containing protein [Planctomycetota bacterium]
MKSSPPFAFKNTEGAWQGVSIDLWRHVADELALDYEFEEMALKPLLNGLANGEIDVGVAAISVTAERNERIDFCHPHFTAGLGIATSSGQQGSIWALV